MSKKQPQEAAATAKFPFAKKATEMVNQTTKAAEVVKANAQYANQPLVQAAVSGWEVAATSVDGNDKAIEANHVELRGLIAERHARIAEWKRTTKAVLSAIDTVAAGSGKSIKDWGFDVSTHVVSPPDNTPPEQPKLTYNRKFEPVLRWKAVPGHRGYTLQLGDGTPTGWGPIIQVAQAHYMLTGMTPGQHISARVAVQRKSGLSAYSDAMSAIVR